MRIDSPTLYIVIPCYNEDTVLPVMAPVFLQQLNSMISRDLISGKSKILFVNDGSMDDTWKVISELAKENSSYCGISLSRNMGHQKALTAGLMETLDLCDITISIDCDGQDDICAMSEMIEKYREGYEVVYGVRNSRASDTFLKRTTAQLYYKLLNKMGVEVVYNHADYRLMSVKALKAFADFKEVNLYIRGLIPLVGFKSAVVPYERKARVAGKSKYPLAKMLGLAIDGITSLSVKPLRIITGFGIIVAIASFLGVLWAIIENLRGATVSGWASMTCIVCFVSGVQLISLGIIGEYIGKIYLETKHRPRYIVSEKTWE